jgi:hypothetical protein
MAFGQPAGPPASAKQMRRLQELILAAGHTDFRDARGPLQLNQRQAGGRFTRDEADEFIARLEAEVEGESQPVETSAFTTPAVGAAQQKLQSIPDAVLAAELQRRGWIVVEP